MIIPAYSITTHLTFRMCLERCRQNLHTLSRYPPIHTALRSQHDKRRLRKLFQRHFRVLRSEELLCDDIFQTRTNSFQNCCVCPRSVYLSQRQDSRRNKSALLSIQKRPASYLAMFKKDPARELEPHFLCAAHSFPAGSSLLFRLYFLYRVCCSYYFNNFYFSKICLNSFTCVRPIGRASAS